MNHSTVTWPLGCALLLMCYAISMTQSTSVTPCPKLYTCRWYRDPVDGAMVLGLHCKPKSKLPFGFEPIDTVIDSTTIPSNATRLEIKCYAENMNNLGFRGIKVQPVFANLTGVTHVSVKNIELINNTGIDFSGLDKSFRSLEIIDVNLVKLNLAEIYFLRTLILQDLVELDDLNKEMLFYRVKKISKFSLNNVGTKHITFNNWIPITKQLMLNEATEIESVTMRRIQRSPYDLDLFKFASHRRIFNLRDFDISCNFLTNIHGDMRFYLPHLEYFNFANNRFDVNNHSLNFLANVIKHNFLQVVDMSNTTTFDEFNKNNLILLSTCPFMVDNVPSIMLKFGLKYRSVNFRNSILLEDMARKKTPICFMDVDTVSYMDFSQSRTTEPMSISLPLSNLEYLSLQDTNLIIQNERVFHNMLNLKTLLLGVNDIGSTLERHSHALLRNNAKLESLDISACELRGHVQTDLLKYLKSLQYLNMSSNHLLTNIDGIDFSVHRSMKFLNLSTTHLSELTLKTLREFDLLANLTIDLSNNRYLMCTQPLKEWLSRTVSTIDAGDKFQNFLNIDDTYCILKNGGRGYFADLRLLKYSKNNWIKVLMITLAVFVGVSLVAVLIWYKFRWKLALFIYKTKKKFRTRLTEDKLDELQTFAYDVFICYTKSDRAWVLGTLVPRVEAERFTTLIHERDYLPGAVIEDAIKESLMTSRFTLLVITKEFLKSEWCMTELRMGREECRSRATMSSSSNKGTSEMLIPVVLSEDVSMADIDNAGILNRSFLQWPSRGQGHDDRLAMFWDKLLTKLSGGGNIRK